MSFMEAKAQNPGKQAGAHGQLSTLARGREDGSPSPPRHSLPSRAQQASLGSHQGHRLLEACVEEGTGLLARTGLQPHSPSSRSFRAAAEEGDAGAEEHPLLRLTASLLRPCASLLSPGPHLHLLGPSPWAC